ncbi:ATP-binding protein [Saccharibacillus sp. CPCC 101409]|uniref:HAMP domain-containing sensor histidine kinase n=1 Tax=Saccharibacillus sp. CPCC 101409 TaxID=3058041 RepID=UPI0026712C54|nr:sensor histidine kinase [Saccharibacillus sp. CPCC 101409]MDO3411036.1 ATP-binding protein [Saccharibacillus sp. CPCC 101409]
MEILNVRAAGRRRRFGFRSVLTEFVLLIAVLAIFWFYLSSATVSAAQNRYSELKSVYHPDLHATTVPVDEDGQQVEWGAKNWSGATIEAPVEREPRFSDFSPAHKIEAAFYLFAMHGSPFLYLLLLPGTGLFLFYRRRVRLPLREMIEAADRVAAGDLDFRVVPGSRDEFGRIGEAFENMRAGLERSSREMWRVAEERRRLNAAFSHDLRTPLAVLKGRIDLLADFYPSGQLDREETLSAISALRRSADRLERYVSSMNAVQKLDELSPQPQPVELAELAEELAEIGRSLSRAKKLTLTNPLPGILSLDAGIVARVFENLISNAERFAADSIFVSIDTTADSLAITVSDDGPGFAPEALSRAAEPYYRAGEPSADHFGLGLYLCRLLCDKHGGSLTLHNPPTGGAEIKAVFQSIPDPASF